MRILTDEVAGWGKYGRHNPGGAQRDDLRLVSGPRVPYNQLSIQRSCHQMPTGSIIPIDIFRFIHSA